MYVDDATNTVDDVTNRIADMMDVTSEDLVNKNLYDYCHAEDLQKLNKAHVDCEFFFIFIASILQCVTSRKYLIVNSHQIIKRLPGYAYMYILMYMLICIYLCICLYIYIYIYIYISIDIYIYIHIYSCGDKRK